jgi:hypothetical protein
MSDITTLLRIAGTFLRSPKDSVRLLAKIPDAVRGMSYAKSVLRMRGTASLPQNELSAFFYSRTEGRGIWKWPHYFQAYDRHLRKFVGREVHVVEIGIYSGGSLDMWHHYFGTGCRVYGVDLQEACKSYENATTQIFIGDQSDRSLWETVKARVPVVDVLIDDGGHRPEQQIATFEAMLSHLAPGGVYICEDIHGLHNGFSSYLHGLSKSLHAIGERTSSLQAAVSSIHIYPYLVVVEKNIGSVERLASEKRGTEWQPFKI